MKYITVLCLVFFCLGCNEQDRLMQKLHDQQEMDPTQIVLVDTFDIDCIVDEEKYLSVADYPPVFIGELSKTIQLDHRSEFESYYDYSWDRFKVPDLFCLGVLVDTTRIIPNSNPYTIGSQPIQVAEGASWKRPGYCAYPVFIKNLTTDTLSIGYGQFIPIILEALDSTGTWQPLQLSYVYDCGHGLNEIFLPPFNTVITSCRIYEGNYETTFRLKVGFDWFNYSNQFSGSMNYGQFELKKLN
ncbi:MAG: hypothetical protein KDC85_19080 [Saprospiraceae bacterium]|nr:hypothetical protein [Saprospiraceae bacterium]MCB9326964.1 hypothetical protein [Lewinellaceae bacterium]